jgi:hypothetical protein
MQIISYQLLAKGMAINSILAYQKHIFTGNRFSCPHRVDDGDFCLNYVKRMLNKQSLTKVVKSSLQRFKDSAEASKILKLNSSTNSFRCIIIPCYLAL